MRVVLGVVALVLLAACGRPEQQTYPPGVEQAFMQACEAQSRIEGLCGCTWMRIEAEIAPNDFIALERLPGPEREAHALTRRISEMAEACHAELAVPLTPEEPTPAP